MHFWLVSSNMTQFRPTTTIFAWESNSVRDWSDTFSAPGRLIEDRLWTVAPEIPPSGNASHNLQVGLVCLPTIFIIERTALRFLSSDLLVEALLASVTTVRISASCFCFSKREFFSARTFSKAAIFALCCLTEEDFSIQISFSFPFPCNKRPALEKWQPFHPSFAATHGVLVVLLSIKSGTLP